LYFPLGGNRVAKTRWLLNIFIVFVVSGFWHGANWTFIIWGALYGLIYLLEYLINSRFKLKTEYSSFSFGHILLASKTFILVTLVWIFFRSQSFDEAISIFNYMIENINVAEEQLVVPTTTWLFLFLFIVSDIILYNTRFDKAVGNLPYVLRWSVYSMLIFAVIVFAGVDNFPFIYFQF
jgi:D-alanyl-lipoteichoic acid acyltransferase DltB (MBOAT superfamily)